ncbi:MAG: universal stress protein [Acidimicrobiia bacterium]
MDSANSLMIVAAIWLVTGLLMGFVMRRRGHDFWTWLVLGGVLGPLAIPLAIERARFHPSHDQGPTWNVSNGRFDVLAGIDGSVDSIEAITSALALFGGCVTNLTLARVLSFDSVDTYTGAEDRDEAMAQLSEARRDIGFDPTSVLTLYGPPAQALVEYATGNGFELIVVGARGHGLSEALLGSVAERLIGGYDMPVYVGPRRQVAANRPSGAEPPIGEAT